MIIKEFRLINANESLESANIESFEAHYNDLRTKVNPKDFQCMTINGHIIVEGEYHPDARVTYKAPRKKIDYEIDKFPVHLQGEIIKLKAELTLTKEQIKELKRTVNALDIKVIELEKQY